jgi:hypothetical protein
MSLGYIYIKYDKTSVINEKIKVLEQKEEVSDID